MIASALAVELLMCVLQHRLKYIHEAIIMTLLSVWYHFRGLAYSENLTDDDEAEGESVLGLVPHQVGYVNYSVND